MNPNMTKNTLNLLLILLFSFHRIVLASDPVILFSDIVSGPSSGLNDNLGIGAIVTIWGNNLGTKKGKVLLTGSDGKTLEASHIYYWKNADGQLPGGPANLFASHRMQEIAFSLPHLPLGSSEIKVTVDMTSSNSLPFNVSDRGRILWVSDNGNNSNDCTFSSPCKYVNADVNSSNGGLGNKKLNEGDIVYSIGNNEPDFCTTGGTCYGFYLREISGTIDDPISFISYPGTTANIVSDDIGLLPYYSYNINMSKYRILVGDRDPTLEPDAGNPSESDIGILVANGRYVGNFLGENPKTCINGWSGAISSTGNGGDRSKMYGNEIFDIGCENTSRFHHTTYFSVRNPNAKITTGWDFSYNYLHENKAQYGIHFYDENYGDPSCAEVSGIIKVTNNVITDQVGAGISVATNDIAGDDICWKTNVEIKNNLLINTGFSYKALDDDLIPYSTALRLGAYEMQSSYMHVENNTIINFGSDLNETFEGVVIGYKDSPLINPEIKFNNNIIIANRNIKYLKATSNITESKNNIFFSSSFPDLLTPEFETSIFTDPKISFIGSTISLSVDSSGVDSGFPSSTMLDRDLYGTKRDIKPDIGVVEYVRKPNTPTNLIFSND